MYYVYMLRCRDGSLYTGTAADLCRRMRQHAGGGSACAQYTRAHPPRELAGVWRTERQGDALRLEYAVKQLTRREKLALLQRPDTAAELEAALIELVSGGAVFEPVLGVTLDMCLEGTFHG